MTISLNLLWSLPIWIITIARISGLAANKFISRPGYRTENQDSVCDETLYPEKPVF